MADLSEAQFVQRFVAHCLEISGFTHFDDGTAVATYAADVAPTYYADPDQRAEGPEECAESDFSYWGEE